MIIIVSCRHHPEPSCNVSTSTIPGTYKPTSYMYKATPSSQEVEYFGLLYPDPCDRDNVYVIHPNGNYELKDIGEVCSPASTESGGWSLVGNKLELDGLIFTIESFDCKKLVLLYYNLQVPGDQLKVTMIKQ